MNKLTHLEIALKALIKALDQIESDMDSAELYVMIARISTILKTII